MMTDWKARAEEAVRDIVRLKREVAVRLHAVHKQLKQAEETIRVNDETIFRLERVAEAARAWSDSVERGFASDLRPDIARARLLSALRALDEGARTAAPSPYPAGDAAEAAEPLIRTHDNYSGLCRCWLCCAIRSYDEEPKGGDADDDSARTPDAGLDVASPADSTSAGGVTRADLNALRSEMLEEVARAWESAFTGDSAFVRELRKGRE
jgi:hypothetical protein